MKKNLFSAKQGVAWQILLVSSLSLLTSCKANLRDLYYDENSWNTVQVLFDWQEAPEAKPQGMTVLFYDEAQVREPERYDYSGTKGGTANLMFGAYRAIAYNYDTETILYRNTASWQTLEAYTRLSSIEEGAQIISRGAMPRALGTESEPVILEPDPFWAGADEPVKVIADEPSTTTVTPSSRIETVEVDIYNVPNLQYTGQIGGALSGLAPGVKVATGELLEGSATQSFTCQRIDDTTLRMRFHIFGHCPYHAEGIHNRHMLTVYAVLADNSKWYYTLDVTEQIHNAKAEEEEEKTERITLYIDEGLPIPKPVVNGSGFQPSIDGWQGVEIEVGM